MLTLEGHAIAEGIEIEPFEWTSPPTELRDGQGRVVYEPVAPTRIDNVELIDVEGDEVDIDFVQVGNVILTAFTKRHPVADIHVRVEVRLMCRQVISLTGEPPPASRATVRIKGLRLKVPEPAEGVGGVEEEDTSGGTQRLLNPATRKMEPKGDDS